MGRRIGAVLILVEDKESINRINQIIGMHADVIIGRQGIPLRQRGLSVISLVLEGNSDTIGALTGPLGKLPGVQVKSILMRSISDHDHQD